MARRRPGRKMDPVVRRHVMASIKKVNTKPELALRSALWRAGVRGWRCHVSSLPGTPDLAFSRWRLVVHVDGVWWHGHPAYFRPGRRGPYWDQKIAGNKRRDRQVDQQFKALGWLSLRVWDMEVLHQQSACVRKIIEALRSRGWSHKQA